MSALFPELRGVAQESEEAAPSEAEAASGVRPGTVAGPECVARFAAALGITGRLHQVRVGPEGEVEFQAAFDDAEDEVTHFALVPADRRAWLRAEGFAVVHTRSSASPPDALDAAMRQFIRRYGHVPLEEFARRVEPEAGDAHALTWDDASTLFYSYGAGKAWRTFTESNELYRAVCEEIHGPDVVAIKHEEHECSFNRVYGDAGSVGFFNTVGVGEDPERLPSTEGLITDIEDLDVIKGGDARLQTVLESVADLPEKPSLVVIHNSCVPSVTGDDVGAAASKAEAKVGVPFVVLGQENNPQDILLRKLLHDPAIRGKGTVPNRVNLLGFPDMPGRAELVSLLEAAGVEVGCSVFPDLSPDALVGFGEAAVNVAYGWARYEGPISGIAESLPGATFLRPPAPFGVEGSHDWLLAVAGAVGREEAARALADDARARLQEKWDGLRARAAPYRLGLISDRPDWQGLFGESRLMGVPLLELITELGFDGVDVLAFSGTGPPEPPLSSGQRVIGFASMDELCEAISSSPAVAFYSEMYFDRRLTRLGKNIFSLRDVDCGFLGAERTLERLLMRCATPFYRLYGHLCGPAFPARNPS